MQFDVVIAGGGFAGVYCARALAKALGRKEGKKRVALIAERNVLVFQPMLAEVAGSSLSPLDVVNPLRQFCRGVSVFQGTIQRIHWESRTLVFDGGRYTRNHQVGFKHLVVALGSVTDLSVVPGMQEYGWPMKNIADALRLRAAVINRLEEANIAEDEETRARLLTFVVVGGGYTGVETAGQLFDFVKQSRRFYHNLGNARLKVVLAHNREELLGEIGPELGAYARRELERRGIEVRLKARVTAVTARRVALADGSAIEANTVVTTIGNAPNPVVMELCHQLGVEAKKGRAPVSPAMLLGGRDSLWAAGDCAAVPWNDRGKAKTSPPTAQFALRQGRIIGDNIARVLRGGQPRPFTYRYMGQLAAIGERQAVAEVFGFHFKGFLAWWMWRTIYLAKLPGTLRKLRVMIDWTFDLIFPRDISVLLPPPDDVVRSIHLEKDEELFEAHHTCRAYGYVRRGSLILRQKGRPDRTLAAGSLVDQAELAEDGRWASTAVAAEPSDVVLFRGRALQLLQTELRLVRRESAPESAQPASASRTSAETAAGS